MSTATASLPPAQSKIQIEERPSRTKESLLPLHQLRLGIIPHRELTDEIGSYNSDVADLIESYAAVMRKPAPDPRTVTSKALNDEASKRRRATLEALQKSLAIADRAEAILRDNSRAWQNERELQQSEQVPLREKIVGALKEQLGFTDVTSHDQASLETAVRASPELKKLREQTQQCHKRAGQSFDELRRLQPIKESLEAKLNKLVDQWRLGK